MRTVFAEIKEKAILETTISNAIFCIENGIERAKVIEKIAADLNYSREEAEAFFEREVSGKLSTKNMANLNQDVIVALQEKIASVTSFYDCGAIIYGETKESRVMAMQHIREFLTQKYGSTFPIYTICATGQAPNQKKFYTHVLNALNCNDTKGNEIQLQSMITDILYADARNTKFNYVVLLVDEAQLLKEKEYYWLMDFYNQLNLKNALLTVFFLGTPELLKQKAKFKKAGKDQIVQRFMIHTFDLDNKYDNMPG